MKFSCKKSLKLVTLLVTSVIIASVSAGVYNYLYLNATVGVQGVALGWATGTDTGITTDINGLTCEVLGMTGTAGGTTAYSDPVRLTATGAGVTFYVEVVDVTGPATAKMNSIVVKIYDNSGGSLKGTLTVWSGGLKGTQTSSMTIPDGGIWRVAYEINWMDNAVPGDTVTAALRVVIPP